jgi:SAM-dependent methyltransferase
MTASESTPLVHDSVDGAIRHVIDGYSYALNPKRMEKAGLSTAGVLLQGTVAIVLSPALLLGALLFTIPMLYKPIQNRFVQWFIPCIMNTVDRKFSLERTTLLANVRGKVLDVGSGGGHYLRYFHNASSVVALEPVEGLHPAIQQQAKEWLPQEVTFSMSSLELESYLHQYPNEASTFDWIILGNVLCEVKDVTSTLVSVDLALKETGIIYFSEHIGCDCSSWTRSLQDLVNPWWKLVSGGCNLNRDSLRLIQSMPNWRVVAWEYPSMNVGMGDFVVGLAHKVKTAHSSEG